MPRKKCGFGFNCGSMLMQPGLTAEDCPNAEVCGLLTELSEEEQVELIRVREQERRFRTQRQRLVQETIRVTRREAAVMMLMRRAAPQSPESFGVTELLNRVEEQLGEVRAHLPRFEGKYIAPLHCEVHRYNVKRPLGIYWYNKLLADSPIFEPSERQQKVRVIHLSRDDDSRNQEGRAGVERRNRLMQAKTRLTTIKQALSEVLELLEETKQL
jgi:hypothetical protein